MAFKALMRGGIYLLFIIGIGARWVIKHFSQQKAEAIAEDEKLSEQIKDNPLAYVDEPDWHIRVSAIQALKDNPTAESISTLVEHLNDRIYDVRESACLALIAQGETVIPDVIEVLKSGGLDAREMAIKVLADLPTSESVTAIETALLQDESAWVRLPAVQALAKIGAETSIDTLITALNDRHQDVYQAVVDALKVIGTPEAKQAILDHPYHDDEGKKGRRGFPDNDLIELS